MLLLSETVLLDCVGGPDVMREQLDHLAEVAHRPNVELRLLPADGRAGPGRGGFELLTKPGDVEPFMVVTIDVGGPNYHDSSHKIQPYLTMLAHLTGVALTSDESFRRLDDIRETYR